MLRARVLEARPRFDRRAALEALVRITAWPRLVVAVTGVILAGALITVDVSIGSGLRPDVLYVILFVAIAWAGWAADALVGAVAVTVLRMAIIDLPLALSWVPAVAQATFFFGGLAFAIGITAWLRDAVVEVEERSKTDPLTGVLNGPAFKVSAEAERNRATRGGHPTTMVFFDLDRFKLLNDTMGHEAGDAALVRFAELVCETTRPYDIVGRVGGDEFVILLPNTGAAAAFSIVDRIGRSAKTEEVAISFSAGIATYLEPPESVDAMFREADGLMYAAKRSGGGHPVGRVVTGGNGAGGIGPVVDPEKGLVRRR